MQTEQLTIKGMTCGGCTGRVTKALESLNGVENAIVSLSTGTATVQFNEKITDSQALISAVKNAGYLVNTTEASE